jgi:RHS repeat-associated protein
VRLYYFLNRSTVTRNVWGLDLDGTLQGAGGVGGLLAVVKDDGVFLPTCDANGNVTEYVATNGAVAAHYDYSPFGEIVVSTGPLADTFTHWFSTKPWCAVTGLSEYQYRKYRPDIGRWMSRDPIEELGGDNLY